MKQVDQIEIDYKKDILEDNALKDIKEQCLLYLQDSNTINNISENKLKSQSIFLMTKIIQLVKLQKSFKLKTKNNPITEVAKTLDAITIYNIEANSIEDNKTKLGRDITYAIDSIVTTFEILNKIMEDRNIN